MLRQENTQNFNLGDVFATTLMFDPAGSHHYPIYPYVDSFSGGPDGGGAANPILSGFTESGDWSTEMLVDRVGQIYAEHYPENDGNFGILTIGTQLIDNAYYQDTFRLIDAAGLVRLFLVPVPTSGHFLWGKV